MSWTPTLSPLPNPTSRLVVVEPSGALCILDGDSGALLSRQENRAMDLLADRFHPGHLITVEPPIYEEDWPGQLGRYQLHKDRLELISSSPFDAPEGILLDAAETILGLSLSEGATVFQTTPNGSSGKSWGWVDAFAIHPESDNKISFATVAALDKGHRTLRLGDASTSGIIEKESRELEAGDCGVAVFEGNGSFGVITSKQGRLHITWPGGPLDGLLFDAPHSCIQGARWLGTTLGLAVYTGPEPVLRLIQLKDTIVIPLDGGAISESLLPHRELLFDLSRARIWVIANSTLQGISLQEHRVVAIGDCKAIQATLVEPKVTAIPTSE